LASPGCSAARRALHHVRDSVGRDELRCILGSQVTKLKRPHLRVRRRWFAIRLRNEWRCDSKCNQDQHSTCTHEGLPCEGGQWNHSTVMSGSDEGSTLTLSLLRVITRFSVAGRIAST